MHTIDFPFISQNHLQKNVNVRNTPFFQPSNTCCASLPSLCSYSIMHNTGCTARVNDQSRSWYGVLGFRDSADFGGGVQCCQKAQ
jgi:hypothetical protein